MAYRSPGFNIKQEYIQEQQLNSQIPAFPTGIIGASNIIVEGQDALVLNASGNRINYKTGAANNTVIGYPKRNELYDEVDLDSVKIYLIPASESLDIGIRNFSRDYFRGFPPLKVPGIDVSYVDITKVVKETEWDDNQGNIVIGGITKDKIIIPSLLLDQNGSGTVPTPHNLAGSTKPIVIESDGTSNNNFAILVEYKAVKKKTISKTQSFSTAMGNMETNQTVFELKDNPIKFSSTNPTAYLTVKTFYVNDSDPDNPIDVEEEFVYYPDFLQDRDFSESTAVDPEYYVDPMRGLIYINPSYSMTDKELIVEYNVDNPIYTSLKYIGDKNDIESNFGPIHPLNPLSYGCNLVISGSGRGVYAAATTVSDHDYDSIFDLNDMVDIQDKMNMLAERDMYSYIMLSNFSILPQVNSFIKTRESKMDYVKFTLGFNGFNDASVNFSTNDKSAILEDVTSKIDSVNEKRLNVFFNPVIKVNYNGFAYPVPGVYGAAAIMSLNARYMNETTPYNQLTYQTLPMISGVYYPLDNRLYFNEAQIENLSASGFMVLEQGVEGLPTLVDQVTTDTLDVKGSEHSVVASVDWSSKDINDLVQNKLKNTQNLTMSSIRLIVDMVNERLVRHAELGLINKNVRVDDFGVDPENPKFVNITINYFPELPMKGGTITLKVQSR